jgi:hypothetical protein
MAILDKSHIYTTGKMLLSLVSEADLACKLKPSRKIQPKILIAKDLNQAVLF